MRVPDPLHLALLITYGTVGLVIIPIGIWIGYRRTCDRLAWAKRIWLGYALGSELYCGAFILDGLAASFPPLVATDLTWLALACVPAGACVLVYAGHWHWLNGGWR